MVFRVRCVPPCAGSLLDRVATLARSLVLGTSLGLHNVTPRHVYRFLDFFPVVLSVVVSCLQNETAFLGKDLGKIIIDGETILETCQNFFSFDFFFALPAAGS